MDIEDIDYTDLPARDRNGRGKSTSKRKFGGRHSKTVNNRRGRGNMQNKYLGARGGKISRNKRNVTLHNKKNVGTSSQRKPKFLRNVRNKRSPQNANISSRMVEFDDRDILEQEVDNNNFMGVGNYNFENDSDFSKASMLPAPVDESSFVCIEDVMDMNINTLREIEIRKQRFYEEGLRAMEKKRMEVEEELRALERKRVEDMMFEEEQRRFEEEQKRFEKEQREVDEERKHLDELRKTLEKEKRDLEILKKSVEEEEERERSMSKDKEKDNEYDFGFGINNNRKKQKNKSSRGGGRGGNPSSRGGGRGKNSSSRGGGRGGNSSSRGEEWDREGNSSFRGGGRGGDSTFRDGGWNREGNSNPRGGERGKGGKKRKNINRSSKFDETESDYNTRDYSPGTNRMGAASSLMDFMFDKQSRDIPSSNQQDSFYHPDNYQNTFDNAPRGDYNYSGGNITSEYSQRESYRENEMISNQNRDYDVHTESGYHILSRGFKPVNEGTFYNQTVEYQNKNSFNAHQSSFIGHPYYDNMYDQGRINRNFSENTGRFGSLDNQESWKGDYYSSNSEKNKSGFVGYPFRNRSPIYKGPIGSGRKSNNNQDFAELPSQSTSKSENSPESFYSYRPGDKGRTSKSGDFENEIIDILGGSHNLLNSSSKNSSSNIGQKKATSYRKPEFFGTEVKNENIRSSFAKSATSGDSMEQTDMGSNSNFNDLKRLKNRKKNMQRQLSVLLKKQSSDPWNSDLFPSSEALKIERLKESIKKLTEEIFKVSRR